jgi:hypothetical protein
VVERIGKDLAYKNTAYNLSSLPRYMSEVLRSFRPFVLRIARILPALNYSSEGKISNLDN